MHEQMTTGEYGEEHRQEIAARQKGGKNVG